MHTSQTRIKALLEELLAMVELMQQGGDRHWLRNRRAEILDELIQMERAA